MNTAEVRMVERGTRKLGYALEFRQMLREQPRALSTAVELTQRAEDEYNPGNLQIGPWTLQWDRQINNWEVVKLRDQLFSKPRRLVEAIWGREVYFKEGTPLQDPETGLEVTILGKATRDFQAASGKTTARREITSYFRMRLGDQNFFVKKSLATTNTGFNEFRNSIFAREALKDLTQLEIVEAQLGYTDSYQSWFVSKWVELESTGFIPTDAWIGATPNDYGVRPPSEVLDKASGGDYIVRARRLQKDMISRASRIGIDLQDLDMNLFYNPNTDKFFYLDVTSLKKGERTLGQQWSI